MTSISRIIFLIFSLAASAAMAEDYQDYNYSLNFELDSRTGSYRPAYTYKAG